MTTHHHRPTPFRQRLFGAAAAVSSAVLMAVVVLTPAQAQGAAFTVNSTIDAVDASPGDGVCATAAGDCTLRAAIQETNAIPGADTITLPAATYTLTVFGGFDDVAASGDLDITDELEITGAGAAQTIIDGGLNFIGGPNFEVRSATLVMSHLTIQNGGNALTRGGGIYNNGGTLTLHDVTLKQNIADSGAGVANFGTLTVQGGAFIGNVGGTGTSAGAAIRNVGTLTVTSATFLGNAAGIQGGAIDNLGAAMLHDVTLTDNYSTGGGGGISNGGIIRVTNTAISGNKGHGIVNDGMITITNSTIHGNLPAGIQNRGAANLSNVTVTANSTKGIFNDNAPLPPAGLPPPGLLLTIENTIVAGNDGGNCGDSNPDLESTVSEGHNLSSDGTCGLNAPGDLNNTDPLLGPLADNGGPTLTHALLPGSRAIDAGDNARCPATDQRGFLRPADGDGDGSAVCDIGAYEAGAQAATSTPSATPEVSPTATPTVTPSPISTPVATTTPGQNPGPAAALPAALPATGGAPRSPRTVPSPP
jgi:CSLREA domain-containing protein